MKRIKNTLDNCVLSNAVQRNTNTSDENSEKQWRAKNTNFVLENSLH